MSDRPVVVLVTGDPVPRVLERRGGYASLIQACAPNFAAPWRAFDVRQLDVLPELTDSLGVIVTGSASSVVDMEPWMERTAARLLELVRDEVPLLGICFGHQLLGHALGGQVARNPRGREMGTVELTLVSSDPVVGDAGSWRVNSTHLDSVVMLPPSAKLLGATRLEPHAAVRFGGSAWGVQFHPEIDADVMFEYFEARRALLEAEGFALAAAERSLQSAPFGAQVVERFLKYAEAAPRR
jgi:GMP synthase (glutamine-hydrolysing)